MTNAANASQCVDQQALQEFAHDYVRFRAAELLVDKQRANNLLNDGLKADMTSTYVFDCRPISYIFFYKLHQCTIESISADDVLEEKYFDGHFDENMPTDYQMMAANIRHIVDSWFTFHRPGFYKPQSHTMTSYSSEDREQWASQQVIETEKKKICLAYTNFVLSRSH